MVGVMRFFLVFCKYVAYPGAAGKGIKQSKMRPKKTWKGCPVRYAAGLLGDPWTLVLLRDLMFKDKHYFREFLVEEAPATNILSDRLKSLESAGILCRRRDRLRGNQVYYALSPKGVGLLPAILALIDWSARHDAETEAPSSFLSAYRANPVTFAEDLARGLLANQCAD